MNWAKLILTTFTIIVSVQPAKAERLIVNAATGDINGDGKEDLAILTLSDDNHDTNVGLDIYLRDRTEQKLTRILSEQGKFWGSNMYGQLPEIRISGNGVIDVLTQNTGMGREHWEQNLTLALSDGKLGVRSFSYRYFDTIDHDNFGSCTVDHLSGRAVRDNKPFEVEPLQIDLEAWSDDFGLSACKFRN
jgi:hypothetical protein